MPDYANLIDRETWAFIQRTGAFYPADATDRTVADQRRVYDEMTRAFHRGRPEGVCVEDVSADGVPCRLYTEGHPNVTAVYFHGGGFAVGGLDSHDDICAEIVDDTGYRVLAVDYRLAPEHTHPAPFDDAFTSTAWVERHFDGPIVLAGDSAGGALAASVAHHARGRLEKIVGQVLIYPGLGGDIDRGSYIEHANAPMLTRDEVIYYMGIRTEGTPPTADPTYAALQDESFEDLPPTIVFTADCDPLRDDGPAYVARIDRAGGKAKWVNEPGLIHGYLRARTSVARARNSFERIVLAIESLGQELWPDD